MKECPFCHSKDVEIEKERQEDGWLHYAVTCNYCGCYGPWGATEDYAVEQWNKRGEE